MIETKSYEQDDAFRAKHIIDGIFAPDGSFAIYQLSETISGKTKDEDQQLSSLWRVDLVGGAPKRLTASGTNATSPQIPPDGIAVFFRATRDGKPAQIYRLPLDGGEADVLTTLEQGVTAFALSPDGESIAFAAVEKVHQPPGPNDHIRIRGYIYRFDGVGYLQDARQAVYLMSSKGSEAKRLTEHDGIISTIVWSPDSREIATFTYATAEQKSWPAQGRLSVLHCDGSAKTLVEDAWITDIFWADDTHIGYIAFPDSDYTKQTQLFLIDTTGGSPIARTAHLDLPVGGSLQIHSPGGRSRLRLTPDGTGVIAAVADRGRVELREIALYGNEKYKTLVSGDRTCRLFDRIGTTLLFAGQDFTTPTELSIFDLESGNGRTITHNNAEWHAQITWPELTHLIVESTPGIQIEGWVLQPAHCKPPFKTILYIHGGPHAAFGYGFNEDFHELVGAGYAVAFANPRGSTGYGNAFVSAILEQRGVPETEDFNAFLDELVRRGIADPERLGVTGISGGGHLSAWLIGHTDRFRAAVPEQGSYNMFTEYGISDCGTMLTPVEMGGLPHEQFRRYWELSPVAHAHKCKTPTLLIQGERDFRCPMEEAEQLYTVLKYSGCEVELLRLQCSHGQELTGPPPLRRFRMDAIKDWFRRYIS